eukprot:scaffold2361_cov203-Alexandrium_tamarense.AAC.12
MELPNDIFPGSQLRQQQPSPLPRPLNGILNPSVPMIDYPEATRRLKRIVLFGRERIGAAVTASSTTQENHQGITNL